MNKLLFMFILTLTIITNAYAEKKWDWNDTRLDWYDYEQGLEKMKESNQNGILLFYTDWCPACGAYSELIKDSDVVQSLQGIVLIRVNKDFNGELSWKYNVDGEYIPRTMAISSNGKIIEHLHPTHKQLLWFIKVKNNHRFFFPPDDKVFLVKFANQLKRVRH